MSSFQFLPNGNRGGRTLTKPSEPTAEVVYENINNFNNVNGNLIVKKVNGVNGTSNNNAGKRMQNEKFDNPSSETLVYDVPSSNKCIYDQDQPLRKNGSSDLVDTLIPSAARLILRQSQGQGHSIKEFETRSDILERDCSEGDSHSQCSGQSPLDFFSGDEDSEGYVEPSGELESDIYLHRGRDREEREEPPIVPAQDYNNAYGSGNDTDYGLEVIHEETESQMSSSDSEESDFDFDVDSSSSDPIASSLFAKNRNLHKSRPSYSLKSRKSRDAEIARNLNSPKSNGRMLNNNHKDFGDNIAELLSPSSNGQLLGSACLLNDESDLVNCSGDSALGSSEIGPDEALPKHIKISPNWDPEPILARLYTIPEPSNKSSNKNSTVSSGYLSILSGNRKKGTFWNAWKRKFFVLSQGKLIGYEKDNCAELFQSINLVGGKVDFLDPADFVGADQGKTFTNRIIGVDDGKGHYYVFQCISPSEAGKWVEALTNEISGASGPQYQGQYATPILPSIALEKKTPAIFRDIVLVDFGSTNIRAGVLTHQPTLPALFFAAVMSENTTNGEVIYGNEVYLRDNRKNAKISFPIQSTSKMCQNNLDITAVKGFLQKIFKDLRISSEKYRIIINLPRRVDNSCKKSILDLVFNTFQVKSALLCHQSVVSFWAYSSENGIVVDVGERCDIVPVSQGFVLSHAWSRAPYGGHPLKHALRQGLGPQENGLYLSTPAENLVLRFITENFIYTNAPSSRKLSQSLSGDATEIVVEMDLRDVLSLPSLIGVNQTVLRGVAEGYFDPGLFGLDCDPLPKLVYKSLQDCGMDIRKEMSQNIFVTGGCTMLPGFVERLEMEVTKLCPTHLKPKIQASPYRYHASFIGASVLSTTEAFERSLVHRNKYDGGSGPGHWLV